MIGIRSPLTYHQRAQIRRAEHNNTPQHIPDILKGTSKLEPLLLITVYPDKRADGKPVTTRIKPTSHTAKIIKYLSKQPMPVTAREIRLAVNRTRYNQIGSLVQRGILTKIGSKRPYSYILTEQLEREAA